jgi:hypothetical protein
MTFSSNSMEDLGWPLLGGNLDPQGNGSSFATVRQSLNRRILSCVENVDNFGPPVFLLLPWWRNHPDPLDTLTWESSA